MTTYVLDNALKRSKKRKCVVTNIVRKYHDWKKSKLRFDDFMQLHELWKEYMKSALDGSVDERLLKADYHGCLLHVTKASNPVQEGIYGIVLRETRNTFMLIRPGADRMVTIPKQGTIFHFVLDAKLYTIYGDNVRATAAGRVQRKFKPNVTIPDFFDA